MSDKKNESDIIGQAQVSVICDSDDMSRDLPMQSAIDVVARSMRNAEKKRQETAVNADIFAKSLRRFLLNHDLLSDDDDRKVSRSFFNVVPRLAKEAFVRLREQSPSYKDLYDELDKLISNVSVTMNRNCLYSENELSDLTDALMGYVWKTPIRPYIRNMLLRETAIKSIDLLALWHSAVDTEGLTREEAIKQLEYCGERANDVSKIFTSNNTTYFCEEVEDINDIQQLQEIWNNEDGYSSVSWEKKHGSFVKSSLMYAIHMIDGTIDRKETKMVMQEIKRRVNAVCTDIDSGRILINPTNEGKIGPNSLVVDNIDFNSKDTVSEYLKFLTKLLSDNIPPDVHTTSDRHRFRAYLPEDPRESHPSFKNLPKEVAEITSATKWMAIIMMLFGTTVDKRNIRNSINTGHGINGNSGRVHRALQWKGAVFIDKYPDGRLREKAKAYMYEAQGLCFVPEGSYEADIAEYTEKKRFKVREVLGVGVSFAEDTLNLCDVFANRYRFLNDSPEARELAEATFGYKMIGVPFMKETVANKILGRLTSDDSTTKEIFKNLFQEQSNRRKLMQTLLEMESYLSGLKRHYLLMRSQQLLQIASRIIEDQSLVSKIAEFNRRLISGQFVERLDVDNRIRALREAFREYYILREFDEHDNENRAHMENLLNELSQIAKNGPSGLDFKLRQVKQLYLTENTDKNQDLANPDQLSLFED
ncbi:hypothetical protein J7J83_02055 [bacterium]|nr:hypothetical protein [bacterium]